MSTTLGTIPQRLLTTTAAARALRVSVSTLKRWTDAGLVTAIRTAGGHRRYDAATLRLPGVDAAPAIAVEDVLHGKRVAALDRLGVELRELGLRWERGEVGVDEEHRVTRRIAAELDAQRPAATRGALAILACPPGEQHELPLRMIRLVLEWRGWRTDLLGADLPWDALTHAIAEQKPRLVALTSRSAVDAPQLNAIAKNTRVILGGSWARGPGKTYLRFRSLRAFDRWLASLH
jgi:excisionase family DNA binding protein